MKKFITILLSLTIIIGMMSVMSFAEDGVIIVTNQSQRELTYLYEKGSQATGWWCNGPYKDGEVAFTYKVESWFSGIAFYAYTPGHVSTPLRVSLLDVSGVQVASKEIKLLGDNEYLVIFEDKNGAEQKFQPGKYTFMFTTLPDKNDNAMNNEYYFVMGSGNYPEGVNANNVKDFVNISFSGFLEGTPRSPVPAIALVNCETGEISEDPQEPTKDPYTYLYDKASVMTGWWCNGPYREAELGFTFDAKDWFSGILFYGYAPGNVRTPLKISVLDDMDKEIVSQKILLLGDNEYKVNFKDENGEQFKIQPGTYTVVFTTIPDEEDDALNNEYYFVMGSGNYPEGVNEDNVEDFIGISCYNFNEGTRLPVPALALINCEAGEIVTPVPATEAPATNTPAPTETPEPATDAPKATDAPTEAPKDEKKSGCSSVIGGSVVALMALVATVIAIRKKVVF